MRKRLRFTVLVLPFAIAMLAPAALTAEKPAPGAVYVLTNQVMNGVSVFDRSPNGDLSFVGTFPTGGSGNPAPQPGDPATDPLASQSALTLSKNNRFLFAVNAGSNEISVFAVQRDGLALIHKVNSGGERPISLTVNKHLLYVLNEGGTPK